MKQLLFSFLLTALSLPTFASNNLPEPPSDGIGPIVKFQVELGRRKLGCIRFGICNITVLMTIEPRTEALTENTATGTAQITDGKLVMLFDRNSMTESTYQYHFGTGKFIVEEDFQLSPEVAAALGFRSYNVKTGNYAIPASRSDSSTIQVSF